MVWWRCFPFRRCHLTSVLCRLEPIHQRLKGGGSGKWPGARRSWGGEKGEVPGVAWCCLPALTPASHGHCSFLCNLFVACQGKSPLKKKTKQTSSPFPRSIMVSSWQGSAERWWVQLGTRVPPRVFSQRAKVPSLRDAEVGMTAPNLGPSDLFLPIRLFSPASRPSSDANHNSWLLDQMTAQVCRGRLRLSCACP